MKNILHNNQSGFTLIELILYVSIVGTLLTATVFFSSICIEARVKHRTIAEVDQQGTAALQYITQTIRNSTSITTPTAGGSGSSLTLVVPTGGLSPTTFDVSSGVLRVTEGTNPAVALTNSKVQVTSITFSSLSRPSTNGIVRISITLSRINPNNRNEYDFTKTFITSAALGQ